MELNSLNRLPPHNLELKVKVNCPIMLLKNLNPTNDLCNGIKMVYRCFCENVIYAEITMANMQGNKYFYQEFLYLQLKIKGIHFSSKKKNNFQYIFALQ